jgi:hypothetical protein
MAEYNPNVAEIHNQTNTRIYNRNIPTQPLQPYLDVRPVMTKYSYLPVVDPRKELNVGFQQKPTFNPYTTFNPGNTKSPWSGFSSNINTESELRNQIYALQKCSKSVYVPCSQSDLYNYTINQTNQTNNMQSHSLLFKTENFEEFNPNPDNKNVGTNIFMNSTRVQVKDMTKQKC